MLGLFGEKGVCREIIYFSFLYRENDNKVCRSFGNNYYFKFLVEKFFEELFEL